MAQHVRVCPGDLDAGDAAQAPQPAGGGMAVHPGAAAVEQDRAAGPGADRLVDGPPDGCWRWDQDDLGAFAAHAQDSVAVFFAEAGDVGAGGFEDPQAEQPEHGDQREGLRIGGLAGCGEQGLELQVGEAERRRLRRNGRSADVLGR